ncbi:MAG: stalk domain-containing protein [Firmicutes bacterium]|nr:stalk domain-containing protein [Bacillota bacterium]
MKFIFCILTIFIFGAVLEVKASDISVIADGQNVYFTDVYPTIIQDRTLVPVRGVFENMGFTIGWNEATSTATLLRRTNESITNITITTGDAFLTVNDERVYPEVPPQIINGRFMLPLRAIAEATGASVDWLEPTRTVLINSNVTADLISLERNLVDETSESLEVDQNLTLDETEQIEQIQETEQAEENNETEETPSNYSVSPMLGQSSIALPNRRLTEEERQEWINDYNSLGGAAEFELEIIVLINVIRAENNLSTVSADPALMMAARFYAQTMEDFAAIGHNVGPYAEPNATHGASRNIADAFGGRMTWNGGNAAGAFENPQATVDAWMASSAHRTYILAPEHNFIGVGNFGGFNYMMFAPESSQG